MSRLGGNKGIIPKHPGIYAATALLAASALAGCSNVASTGPNTVPHRHAVTAPNTNKPASKLDLFVSTGDTDAQDAQVAKMISKAPKSLGELTIAFADVSANGLASAPTLSPGLVALVDGLPKSTQVAVAYDGSSPPYTSLNGILSHPKEYVTSVEQTQDGIQAQLSHKIDRADLDFEYPPASKSAAVTAIVSGLERYGLPVTIEMGPGNSEGLDLSAIAKTGADVDVMALDNAIGAPTAQANAAGTAAIGDLQRVIQSGVPASHVSLELPAYAQEFPGATHFGQAYPTNKTFEVPDNRLGTLHITSETDDPVALTASGVSRGNLLSWQSPSDVRGTLEAAAKLGVHQASLWEGSQVTGPILVAAMTQ